MHKIVLMEARVRELKEANIALSKRRRAKKCRIQAGGPLTIQGAVDILDDKDMQEQLREETRARGGRTRRATTGPQRYGNYGNIGHNSRICQVDIEMDSGLDSE